MTTDLWTLGRERLAAELPAQQFNTWIRPLPVPQVTVAEDGASTRVALRAPNRFMLDWIRNQYASRIETVLRSVDLWTRRHDPVRTYSRGMVQRLAIGRAILHDPPVLLLDEPDTGLDQVSARNLASLVSTLRRSRRAVLLTTHHLERAVDWADRLAFLADGEVVEEVPTASLDYESARARYEHWIG